VFRLARGFLMDNLNEGTLSGQLARITGHRTSNREFEINTVFKE